MIRYYLAPCAALLGWAALGYAQEPLPPPSLPSSGTGWLDMLVKMSPFIIGMLAPYGNEMFRRVAPATIGRLPVPAVSAISSVVSMLASALAAYTTGQALDGKGGVSPEVAITESGGASILAHTVAQKAADSKIHERPVEPTEPPKEG